MTTYVNNGTGKLYPAEGKEPVATIAYRIYRNPATEGRGEEWWGRFALDFPIAEAEEYNCELEDGRTGFCSVKVTNVHQITESLTFYHYDLKGIGFLK